MSRPVAGPPLTTTGRRLLKHLNDPSVQSALSDLLTELPANHRHRVAVERLLGDNAQRIRAIEDEAVDMEILYGWPPGEAFA